MKTPLQELIEFARKRKDFVDDDSYKEAMQDVLLIALNLLTKEKNHIQMAFIEGKFSEQLGDGRTPDEHFKTIYQQ